jgi:hypothetical protein
MDNSGYPGRIAPFSSDESRMRHRLRLGGYLALVPKLLLNWGIWAHLADALVVIGDAPTVAMST